MEKYRYRAMKVNGKRIDEHRLVAQRHFGKKAIKGMVIHHKNGNKMDNRIENLEIMTRSEHSRMHMAGHSESAESRRKQSESKRKMGLERGSRRNEPVIRISLDGKEIKKYPMMWDVEKDGFQGWHVREVCEHVPKRKTHGGYRWMFLSEYESLQKNPN